MHQQQRHCPVTTTQRAELMLHSANSQSMHIQNGKLHSFRWGSCGICHSSWPWTCVKVSVTCARMYSLIDNIITMVCIHVKLSLGYLRNEQKKKRKKSLHGLCSIRKKGGDSSVVRAPDSWSKGCGFESLLERGDNFLLQGRLSVLTLISVSVPPPCYCSST